MSKNDKLKIRSDSLYKNNIQKITNNNSGMLGINLPYEHLETKDENISAYRAVAKSVACYQFTPIFFSSPQKEVVWLFKYPDKNKPNEFKIVKDADRNNLYANVWFKMGLEKIKPNRPIDYENAHTSLIRAVEKFQKSKKIKKNDAESLLEYIRTWGPPNYVPPEKIKIGENKFKTKYLWHHVFMGFQKTPPSIPTQNSKKEKNFNYYIECNNQLLDFVNFSKDPINDPFGTCKTISTCGCNCINACDWWYDVEIKRLKNEINSIDFGHSLKGKEKKTKLINELKCKIMQLNKVWNCEENMAVMQLVNAQIHTQTYTHTGSSFQRDLILGREYEDDKK